MKNCTRFHHLNKGVVVEIYALAPGMGVNDFLRTQNEKKDFFECSKIPGGCPTFGVISGIYITFTLSLSEDAEMRGLHENPPWSALDDLHQPLGYNEQPIVTNDTLARRVFEFGNHTFFYFFYMSGVFRCFLAFFYITGVFCLRLSVNQPLAVTFSYFFHINGVFRL